jgi:MFS family permease
MEFLEQQLGANRAVLALSVGRMGDAIGNSVVFTIVPIFIAQLPHPLISLPSVVLSGILLSLFGIANAALQPFAGAFIDRLNRRKPFVLAGLIVLFGATLGYVFAGTYTELLVMRVFQGFGVALAIPATLAILTNATEKSSRGGSMGVFSTSRVIGLAIGPLIGGFLYDRYGFNTAFYVGAGFVLLGVIAVQLWVQEVRAPEEQQEQQGSFQLFDTSLLTASFLGLGFATFVMASSFSMITPLENQFNQRLQQGALAFGAAFSALMVTRILTQIPLGRLTDQRGRKLMIVGGLLLMALSTAPMGLVRQTWQLVLLRAFQGLASAGIAAPAFALAGDLSQAGGEGRQMSIITMGFVLGLSFGTLIAGILAIYWLELPFILGGALSLVGAWVVFQFVPETV